VRAEHERSARTAQGPSWTYWKLKPLMQAAPQMLSEV